ncbi:hypothetical protein BDZ97DRAFT_1928824 [Flammula alnicola]|nr:hypothetical protein BDZ97DRAFT_1928824 [Flammula alnicola]
MLSPDDPFAPVLKDALDYNYPPLKTRPDIHQVIQNPITFYDRHIDSNLILKHVAPAPSLPQDLSAKWDGMLGAFTAAGRHFHRDDYLFPQDKPANMHDSKAVGEQYYTCVARNPQFKWEGAHTTGYPTNSPLRPPLDAPKMVLSRETTPKHQRSKRVLARGPNIKRAFSASSTTSHGVIAPNRDKKSVFKPTIVPVKVPGRRGVVRRKYRPNGNDYIQRTWASAVKYDATFMVFNCGTYERIGIRHRGSQTLYLSDAIDTVHCKNPKYRQLHMGLHIAILQDALERYTVTKSTDGSTATPGTFSRKRSAENLESAPSTPSKRRKASGEIIPRVYNEGGIYKANETEKEISCRELALIRLDYDHYRSPAPSSFIRQGPSCVPGLFNDAFEEPDRKSVYSSSQFMTVTLHAPIGTGAVGVIHRAVIEVETDSGKKLHRCLVKLGFSEAQQTSMRNEYNMYAHLAKVKTVAGVVRVHGLFQDIETGTMALVMDHGGKSLRTRELEKDSKFKKDEVYVPQVEVAAFSRALEGIHRGGILHRDIRLDNLLVNEDNEVSVIDFDRAVLCTYAEVFADELDELRGIVNCIEENEGRGKEENEGEEAQEEGTESTEDDETDETDDSLSPRLTP